MVVVSLLSTAATGYLAWLADGSLLSGGVAAGLGLAAARGWGGAGALLSLLATATWTYARLGRVSTGRLVHCPADGSLPCPAARRRAATIQRIIQRCPELRSPRYLPTFWAADTWSNCGLFVLKQLYDKSWLRADRYTREVLTLPDGGTVSIDWADCPGLPDSAPVVIFLHTITGSATETGHFLRLATRRGWRSCVFNRRGHAMTLTSPRFNLMGESEDTAAQVAAVVRRHPARAFLAMVGISAGSGLLVTYLGKEGDRTPVQAAASLCPAYDISAAFSRLSEQQPTVDRHILGSMKRLFLGPNEALLSVAHPAAWAACRDAATIHQFLLGHVAFAGCADAEQYFTEHNPMAWVDKVARPTLLLNSEDDIVCLAENIREDVVGALPGALLLRTQRGSHIAYNEGVLGTGCYMSRVTMDFLQAAWEVEAEGEEEG